jgi:hypothetical protein
MNALNRRGQILPGVIAVLMILAVLIPALVTWIQREAYFSVKQAQNTTALHLAEAGVEKAYLMMTQSTTTWANLMNGVMIDDYNFDRRFEDIPGGHYAVAISSGPEEEQATIYSVGRDALGKEVRALKVVYANAVLGDTAIYAGRGVQIGGGVNVHWGGVMSPYTIDAASRNYPQFWSSSQITSKDTSATPPNCDSPNCCQWHSYQANLPPAPSIDFDFYRSSAAATTGCPAGGTPAGSCYYSGNVSNWDNTTTGKTIFIEGDLSVKSPGMFHTGTMIVMGNINLPNGVWGKGNVTMRIPSEAWKQYCNSWATYQAFDAGAPASFPGMESSYAPAGLTYSSSKIAVNGFLYVGGNFNNGGGGGGNSDIYGVLYAVGSATQTASSGVSFYYNGAATEGLVTTNVSLSRVSWQSDLRGWPSGL